MTDENRDDISIELTWKFAAILLAIIIFCMGSYYLWTETYFFTKSPCNTLAQQIVEKKNLWTQHCAPVLYANGTTISTSIQMTNETRWD